MRRWLGAALGASLGASLLVALGVVAACDKGEAVQEGLAITPTEAVEEEELLSPRAAPGLGSARPRPTGPGTDAGPVRSEAPLLWWMREHAAAALRQGDTAALGAALDELATFAPPEPAYGNWASIARDGAGAARAASLDGVKASCRGCHAQYRNPYKAEMRARPLPSWDGTRGP
jgi:hypothetical protein